MVTHCRTQEQTRSHRKYRQASCRPGMSRRNSHSSHLSLPWGSASAFFLTAYSFKDQDGPPSTQLLYPLGLLFIHNFTSHGSCFLLFVGSFSAPAFPAAYLRGPLGELNHHTGSNLLRSLSSCQVMLCSESETCLVLHMGFWGLIPTIHSFSTQQFQKGKIPKIKRARWKTKHYLYKALPCLPQDGENCLGIW